MSGNIDTKITTYGVFNDRQTIGDIVGIRPGSFIWNCIISYDIITYRLPLIYQLEHKTAVCLEIRHFHNITFLTSPDSNLPPIGQPRPDRTVPASAPVRYRKSGYADGMSFSGCTQKLTNLNSPRFLGYQGT